MQRHKVKSSLLAMVGYDPETKVLEVEFLRQQTAGVRRIYRYADVEPEKYAAMVADKSIGGYFIAKIKPDHQFTRIDEDATKDAQAESANEVPEVRQEQSGS